ncbi:MAG: carboxypeptidase-like regulatory domain-containing protein [Paludibacteraceae bacterium]|nr:carboxypeptidase-like regulatory domain-containing protein [Paludibacteraceae bacterium]
MTNIKSWILGTIAACSAMFISCNKPKENLSNCEDYVFTDSVSNSHVYGFVYDADGNALANVLVTSGKDTAVSNEGGVYSFERCRAVNGRCVIKFEDNNYFSAIRTANIEEGEARVDAILMPQDIKEGVTDVSTFQNSNGTTIKIGKMEIAIPANALVYENDGKPFNGTVFASAYYLNPNSENFTKEMPGGDMSGVTSDGKSVILLSYGMVEITMKDSLNQKLQLKDGAESTLTFPTPEGFTEEQKHNEIPLWYFDEEKGTWVEEGIATKNGDTYSGKIKHFSWHNLDYPSKRATICGQVTNKNGTPLPNVLVTISQTSARTDKNGNYCAYVPKNTPVFVTVKPSDYANCPNIPIYNVDGLEATTTFYQDIVLPNMPTIHGIVTDKKQGIALRGIRVCTDKTSAVTNRLGEYTIYHNGNDPFTLFVEKLTIQKTEKMEYKFNNPSEIDENKSYDFAITQPIYAWGYVHYSDNKRRNKSVSVTALIDNKEYKIKTSASGYYSFYFNPDVKEITTYVSASDGLGVESNRVSKKTKDIYWSLYIPQIIVPTGISVRGYVKNTCGISKANISIELGKGKNKKTFSEYTAYGYFDIDLPVSVAGSKSKVKINCQGKNTTKKIDLDKDDIDLGSIEFCSGEKPEPDCIYAVIGEKIVKFDTKKDRYTEMFQKNNKTLGHKYQAWYKSPEHNATLILEIITYPEYIDKSNRLSAYLVSDEISASRNEIYAPKNKENIYEFKTDFELYNDKIESEEDDDEVYLYGSASIMNKNITDNIKSTYIDIQLRSKASSILAGKSNSTEFLTLILPKEATKDLERLLRKFGFVEKSTFMDDEGRFASIFLKDDAEAYIKRNKDNTSDVTILTREGIGQEPLYSCWKVDFKNSSLKGKGKSVDYMWKNEADIAQLVMFGPIMGVKFTKTDITEEKCGCAAGNGPVVAN